MSGWMSGSEGSQRPMTVGFLDENGNDEYHGILTEGLYDAAVRHHVRLVRIGHFATNDTERDPIQVSRVHKFIRQFHLDGLMFLGWHRAASLENEQAFLHLFSGIPLFSVGTPFEGIPSAYFDGWPYVEELLLHLLDRHGYRKIAFISPIWPDSRVDVYHRIMLERGLLDDRLYVAGNLLEGHTVPERGRRALEILLDERKVRPEAIMSLYNIETEGILKELRNRKIRVPEDMAVTSFEDGELARYDSVPYTTILFPWRELGRASGESFFAQLEMMKNQPAEESSLSGQAVNQKPSLLIEVPGRVIVRESCGCRPGAPLPAPGTGLPVKALPDMTEEDWGIATDTASKAMHGLCDPCPDLRVLVRGFLQGLHAGASGLFVREVEAQLDSFGLTESSMEPDPVLTALRSLILPHVDGNTAMLLAAEDMFMQAGVLLTERFLQGWGEREHQAKHINRELEEAGQKIIMQYAMSGLADMLHASMERLGIPDCLVVLSDRRSGSADRFAYCIPVFFLQNRIRLDATMLAPGTAADILWRAMPASGEFGCVMANLLHVNRDFTGFVLYGPGPMDERVYRTLSFHISTAINGIFLKERLEHSFNRLVDNAHKEGMSHAASGILHNIRNVLGSLGTTVYLMQEVVGKSPCADLGRAAGLLEAAEPDMVRFLEEDPRSKTLSRFLLRLEPAMEAYGRDVGDMAVRLQEKNRLIQEILAFQHEERHGSSMTESCEADSLLEDVLELNQALIDALDIRIERHCSSAFSVRVHRTKILHVLVNVVKNACEAMRNTPPGDRVLTIAMDQDGEKGYFRFTDHGTGISAEQLTSIFSRGFTTKSGGHGLGLHTSANDIASMGGSIHAESPGTGLGASFTVSLPLAPHP